MDNKEFKKIAKYKKYWKIFYIIIGLQYILKIREINELDSIIYKIGIVGCLILGLFAAGYGIIMFLETYKCEIVYDILKNKQSKESSE